MVAVASPAISLWSGACRGVLQAIFSRASKGCGISDMKRARLLSIVTALAIGQGALPAQASDPTLEQTAELYYSAWLNHDRAGAVKLNKALRPETGGRDYIDLGMLDGPVAWQLKRMGTLSLKSDPSEPEVRRLMARLIVEGNRRVRCRAVGSRVGSQPAGERFRATVMLECAAPDATAALRQVKERETGDVDMNNPTPRLLRAIIEAFEKAPLTRRISTEMDLNAGMAKQRWMPDMYRTGIDRVTSAVAGQIAEAGLGR